MACAHADVLDPPLDGGLAVCVFVAFITAYQLADLSDGSHHEVVGGVLAVRKPAAESPWFDERVALLPLRQEQKLQLLVELLALLTYLRKKSP